MLPNIAVVLARLVMSQRYKWSLRLWAMEPALGTRAQRSPGSDTHSAAGQAVKWTV